jgi:site-specific recombinase XerD
MTIENAKLDFCDYSKIIRGYSPNTIRRYRHAISFYQKVARVEEFKQISKENIRQLFYYGRTERAWTTQTYLYYHKSLKVFFRWCKDRNYISENPVLDIEVPKLEKTLPGKLTQQEANRILEVALNYPHKNRFLRFRNHAIFSMFLFTGLRKNELLNLKYSDVDTENKTVFVRQGKGNKDRIIPMPHSLVDVLQKYLQERIRAKKTCPHFFTSLNRNRGFTETGLKVVVDKIEEAAKVKFTPHKLRHTFATLMLEGGCDIFSLSKMMGHSDIKTTAIYLAASPEHLRAQVSKHPLNNQIFNPDQLHN